MIISNEIRNRTSFDMQGIGGRFTPTRQLHLRHESARVSDAWREGHARGSKVLAYSQSSAKITAMKTAWGKESYSDEVLRIDFTKEDAREIAIALALAIESGPKTGASRLRKILDKIQNAAYFKPDTRQKLSIQTFACEKCIKKSKLKFPELIFDFKLTLTPTNEPCDYCGVGTNHFIESWKTHSR